MDTWNPLRTQLLTMLESVLGSNKVGDDTPTAIVDPPYAVITMSNVSREFAASLTTEVYTVGIRVLTPVNYEEGAKKQLEDLYPLITQYFDQRRSLKLTVNSKDIQYLTRIGLVDFNADMRIDVASTPCMFMDYTLFAVVKTPSELQV